VGRLLYTGATIRHSYLFMKKRQATRLKLILHQLAKKKDLDPAKLEEKLRQVDS
jgi:hypothetical protein